ncbi:hypothetical protein B0T10DRAFT_588669 [Thelonectria olida]|uniref:Uncharacterized protein n=1 Tax=Thelonectria olida TaxID=1576542 RepID=A0A9P9AIZ6_9HYPO|nr:hypothetical protein B0T10DRAFT_588669 [Thelonectria olida]
MSASLFTNDGPLHPRKPFESQKNAGGDMSMMFFIQPDCPSRFACPDQHRIKGLNAETIARVLLPPPPWIMATEYATLRADPSNSSTCIFFSLNLSIYNQQIDPSDWTDAWFFMNGRVHPYSLTWEIKQADGLESEEDGLLEYTIPALIVRDQSYQPITPRNFTTINCFPVISPVVSFTGPIIGCGRALLQKESIHTLGEIQLKCCGFVHLSTFITPGNPDKTPYKGFHPFQVFVIFPIHANPWASLCKKMTDRQDTQFQANTMFTCTGKVAGLLDHRIMVHPPDLEHDYVFIVVPDTWTFLDKAIAASASSTPSLNTPSKRPSSGPLPLDEAKAMFTSLPKRISHQPIARPSAPPSAPSCASGPPSTPPTRLENVEADHTPTKKPRLSQAAPSSIHPLDRYGSPKPRTASAVSQDDLDGLQANTTTTTPSIRPSPPTARLDTSTIGSITALPLDSSNRPHRTRHPPKKFQEVD